MLRKIEKTYIITFKDGRSTEDWHDYREEKLIEISDSGKNTELFLRSANQPTTLSL